MHIRARLISWLANCQPIIDQDLFALQRYIASYACKRSATTEDLVHVYRHLIDSAGEQSTVRNLAQRLLLKTIGMTDTPAACVDYLNTETSSLHKTI